MNFFSAVGADVPVNTDNGAAVSTIPPVFLIFQELFHALIPDLLKILDHAHPVFCPVSIIQALDPGTWEDITLIAEI